MARVFANRAPDTALTETAYQRLIHCHGDERAARIAAGRDHQANADIAAWRSLGTSKPYVRKVVRR